MIAIGEVRSPRKEQSSSMRLDLIGTLLESVLQSYRKTPKNGFSGIFEGGGDGYKVVGFSVPDNTNTLWLFGLGLAGLFITARLVREKA